MCPYSIFSHWDIRAKFVGMAGPMGVVADQETDWFELLFVPLLPSRV